MEHGSLSERLSELLERRSQIMGRLALLREVFASSNIFDADDDPTSEAQWIQQAFQSGDDGVRFDHKGVEMVHETYQLALNELMELRQALSDERLETEQLLGKARDLTKSLSQNELRELHQEASRNEFSRHALTTVYRILGIRTPGVSSLPDDMEMQLRTADLAFISQSNAKLLKTAATHSLFQSSAFYGKSTGCPKFSLLRSIIP